MNTEKEILEKIKKHYDEIDSLKKQFESIKKNDDDVNSYLGKWYENNRNEYIFLKKIRRIRDDGVVVFDCKSMFSFNGTFNVDLDTVEEFQISKLKSISNNMKTNKQMEEIFVNMASYYKQKLF